MKYKGVIRALTIVGILICNVGCDQISKKIIRQHIDYNEHIDLIKNVLTLTKIENTGAFLSLGQSLSTPIKLILLTILPVLALIFGLIYLLTNNNLSKLKTIGISFMLGGGIGNIFDRIIYGSVTDFLHIDFVIFQTGIFNMADVSIMAGMLLFIYDSYFNSEKANYTNVEKQNEI